MPNMKAMDEKSGAFAMETTPLLHIKVPATHTHDTSSEICSLEEGVSVTSETSSSSSSYAGQEQGEEEATFLKLLHRNRPFRLSLFSYLVS